MKFIKKLPIRKEQPKKSNGKLKLFEISQNQNGYDTYSGAIVAAPNATIAKRIHSSGDYNDFDSGVWCHSPSEVAVTCIGNAKKGIKQGVILASFNAS